MKTLQQAIKDNQKKEAQKQVRQAAGQLKRIREAQEAWDKADLEQGYCVLVSS